MYSSRLEELKEADGNYTKEDASKHLARYIHGAGIDNMRELSYYDRKALHNLKYYTWVEQQGKSTEDLNRLWDPEFWAEIHTQIPEWDSAIESFNSEVVK